MEKKFAFYFITYFGTFYIYNLIYVDLGLGKSPIPYITLIIKKTGNFNYK